MAKPTWLPIALSALGLGGLLASWACFPPLMVGGGPPPPTAEVEPASPRPSPRPASPSPASPSPLPGSPAPSGSPSAAPSAVASGAGSPSAAPSAVASGTGSPFGALAPAAGRTYVYRTAGTAGRLQVTVTALEGAVATYATQTVPDAGSPAPATTGEARLTNGIYWVFPDRPNPVVRAIDTYPAETVAVPAGTGLASRVDVDAERYWFVDGIIVKAVTAAGTTELQEIK